MEQSDIDLVQTAPSHHVQTLLRAHQASTQLLTSLNEATPTREHTEEIAHYLFDATTLQHALTTLGEIERAILYELTNCGGRANSRDLALYFTSTDLLAIKKNTSPTESETVAVTSESTGRHAYKPEESLSPQYSMLTMPQYPPPHPHGIFEQNVRRLLLHGLLFWGKQTNFAGRDYANGIHDGVLIVPHAVRAVVRHEWGMPERFPSIVKKPMEDGSSEQPLPQEQDVSEGIRLFQRTLYLYWSLAASTREGLTLLSSGLLTRSSLRILIEQIKPGAHYEQVRSESDVPSLLFMRLLLTKLGLLQVRGTSITAASAIPFFSLPLLERTRRCYQLWLETPLWDELLYLPEVTVRPGASPTEPAHEEVVRGRQNVMTRLTYEPLGAWQALTTLIARTKLYIPNLLFPRNYGPRAERYSSTSNPYGWDFRLRRGWLTHREGWHMVEGGFIRAILSGPLYWLGLVELNQEEMPTAFSLLPMLKMTISDDFVPQQEQAGRLIVQPNFELIILAPVSEALLVSLDRFAERVSLELIAQYRLTKASVTRAIQTGMHAEAIQKTLEEAVEGEIPQNVCYSLIEWERQIRRVELWQNATLLEVDDPALLDSLFANEEVRSFLHRRISPTLAEVVTRQLPKLQELLWQRDYLPSITSAPPQGTIFDNGRMVQRETQWLLHENGLLQPLYAVLDLYLTTEVEHFSDYDQQSGWREITITTLQRALATGRSLEYIIRFLQQYCEGGIPTSFLIRLKLWGGGYGESHDIYVEQAPLLRLSDAVLQDLQADQEIRPLLGKEIEQQTRLVQVEAQHLQQILALLRERGFTVE